MRKKIINQKQLAASTQIGMDDIADIVGKTLGPGGLPIILERVGQALDGEPLKPRITKDGVSVANQCFSQDPVVDVIIQTVKAICQKTNQEAGDGTTTAIVIGRAIMRAAMVELERTTVNLRPQEVKRSLYEAAVVVIERLEKDTRTIDLYEEIAQVATLSANGDEEVGEIIAKAFEEVGAEGVITVDEGKSSGLELETVKGYRFQRGAQGRELFFNNPSGTKFEAENAAVIIFDGPIRNHTDLAPAFMGLGKVDPNTRQPTVALPPMVIIANDFSRDAIQFLLIQKEQAGIQICPVMGPHITNIRTKYLEDIAVFTGGKKLGNGGKNLLAIGDADIGRVGKVVIDKYKTTLFDGAGQEASILNRVDSLTAEREGAESEYDLAIINDRMACLVQGIAKILVGGSSGVVIKERYDRIEDALNAARHALNEGVVAGGGVALLRIAQYLRSQVEFHKGQNTVGNRILASALEAPFYQITDNAGIPRTQSDSIKKQILDSGKWVVYDAADDKIVDVMDVGIFDPLTVTRSAFTNALGVSSLLVTAGGAIINERAPLAPPGA